MAGIEYSNNEFVVESEQKRQNRISLVQTQTLFIHLQNENPYEIVYVAPNSNDQGIIKRTGTRFFLRNKNLVGFDIINSPARLNDPPTVKTTTFPFSSLVRNKLHGEPEVYFTTFKDEILKKQGVLKKINEGFTNISNAQRDEAQQLFSISTVLREMGVWHSNTLFSIAGYENSKGQFSTILADLTQNLILNLGSVMSTMSNRNGMIVKYENSCKNTQKQLQKIEGFKLSTHIPVNLVNTALDDLKKLKQQESEEKEGLNESTKILRSSSERFEDFYEKDIVFLMNAYVKHQVNLNTQIMKLIS